MSTELLIFITAIFVVVCFCLVVFFGAPYLPTLKQKVPLAIDLADLKKGQLLLELGSGDGRVLIEAAKREIFSIGYELNPLLVIYSKLRARRYKRFVKIYWANFWRRPLPKCDAIFVFLLNPYMAKLDQKIRAEAKTDLKLVSFAFKIPNKKITKMSGGMFLYTYDRG